jgi:hypothetical protein
MLISLPFAVVPFTEEGDWLLFVMSPLMIVGFGGSGYYFLSYYYRHRVSWDRDAFTLTTRNGVTTTLRWADVTAASHQPSSGFLLLYTTMGVQKISAHMNGLRAFRIALREQTNLNPQLPI